MFNKKHTCLLPVQVISVISKYELNINLHVLLAQPQKILTLRAITFQNGCNITGIVILLAGNLYHKQNSSVTNLRIVTQRMSSVASTGKPCVLMDPDTNEREEYRSHSLASDAMGGCRIGLKGRKAKFVFGKKRQGVGWLGKHRKKLWFSDIDEFGVTENPISCVILHTNCVRTMVEDPNTGETETYYQAKKSSSTAITPTGVGENNAAESSTQGAVFGTMNNTADSIVVNQASTINNRNNPRHVNKRRRLLEEEEEEERNERAREAWEFFENADRTEANEIAPLILRGSHFKVVQSEDPYIISDSQNQVLNVTGCFQKFQKYAIIKCNAQGLILETHPYHVLGLSSILLLKPEQYSEDLLTCITSEQLDQVRIDVLKKLGGNEYEQIKVDMSLKMEMMEIIEELNISTGKRNTSMRKLVDLIPNTDTETFESRILWSIVSYIQKLPKLAVGDPLGEIELCAGYLDPLFSLLFNDFEHSTNFRWANKVTNESQRSSEQVNSQRRPDAVMAVMNQRRFNESRGFGEVKTAEAIGDNYCLTKDLIRLGIFGKQAIDIHGMKATLLFQAIGSRVFFYIQTLVKDGLYMMVEVDVITIPLCLKDLTAFVSQVNTLKKIYTLYNDACVATPVPIRTAWKRTTLDSPSFSSYINSSGSKTNNSVLIFN